MTDAHHQLFRTYEERPHIVRVCGILVTFRPAKRFGALASDRLDLPEAARDRAGTGCIANANANATGKRLRNLPLTRKRIKDAIGA
jgi:hypothetical protein